METLATRKRSRNACWRCRVRKTRCTVDSQFPCSSCDSAGTQCILLDRDFRKKLSRHRSSKIVSTQESPESTLTENDCLPPTTPTNKYAHGIAPHFADTAPDRVLLYSPSHVSKFGPRKPPTADAVTDTANHQISSWLLLCPIPFPDHLKKGLEAYMSRKEAGSDELLSILLRCLESIRMRVSEIRPILYDKSLNEISDKSHCCCNGHERLDKIYEQSHIQQSGILAKCQHLLELCINTCGRNNATSPLDSGIAPSDTVENGLTMRPEISSDMLSDRDTFCLDVSPLDIPKGKAVSRAGKDDEDYLRKWELDLMMANFSQVPNENILADAERPKKIS